MDLDTAIATRRSIKKYLPKEVEHEKLVELIEAGMQAPSPGNLQPWRFIVVADQEMRQKLATASLEQLWMQQAPLHLVVCAEIKRCEQYYGARGKDHYAKESCAAAIENILLKATALGLGSCWVGAFNERIVARELDIPEEALPIAILTIGYSDEKPKVPSKAPLDSLVFFEKWDEKEKPTSPISHAGKALSQKISKAKEAVQRSLGRS